MTGAAFPTEHTNPPKACPFLGTGVYNIFKEKKTGEWNLQDKHFSQSIPGHLLLKFCSCFFSFLPTPKDDSGKGEKRKSNQMRWYFLPLPQPHLCWTYLSEREETVRDWKDEVRFQWVTKEGSVSFLKFFILSFAESGLILNFMFSFGGRLPKSTFITLHLISPNNVIFRLS